jgi:hypothetical protein
MSLSIGLRTTFWQNATCQIDQCSNHGTLQLVLAISLNNPTYWHYEHLRWVECFKSSTKKSFKLVFTFKTLQLYGSDMVKFCTIQHGMLSRCYFYKQYKTNVLHLASSLLLEEFQNEHKKCYLELTKYRPVNSCLTEFPMSDRPAFKPWCTAICPHNHPEQPNLLEISVLMGVKCSKCSTEKTLKLVFTFTRLHLDRSDMVKHMQKFNMECWVRRCQKKQCNTNILQHSLVPLLD